MSSPIAAGDLKKLIRRMADAGKRFEELEIWQYFLQVTAMSSHSVSLTATNAWGQQCLHAITAEAQDQATIICILPPGLPECDRAYGFVS